MSRSRKHLKFKPCGAGLYAAGGHGENRSSEGNFTVAYDSENGRPLSTLLAAAVVGGNSRDWAKLC